MRPCRLSTLQGAAANGPIVILNASKTCCTALVLTLNDVQHIPLLDLSLNQVTNLVKLIQHAIAQGGRNDSLIIQTMWGVLFNKCRTYLTSWSH